MSGNQKTPGTAAISTTRAIIILLRPRQWSKNLLLFAALLFSATFLEPARVLLAFLGFISFCLLSGAGYILNDIMDRDQDRAHPHKRKRPLASGAIGVKPAVLAMLLALSAAFTLALFLGNLFFLSALAYFVLSLCYSLRLKQLVIIDAFVVASGFLIRAAAGAFAVGVTISPWLLLCTLLLALFLVLTKRRQETLGLARGISNHRRVLAQYPLPYLDQLIGIVTAATIIAYALYTFTAGHSIYLMLTIPLVMFGIFRYLYLVHMHNFGESPEEVLLKDGTLIATILLWAMLSGTILLLEQGGGP